MRVRLAVPDGQRYSCRQCGWCCRGWRIQVDPAERDRLRAHDWAAESPRLRDLWLFEERWLPGQTEPSVQTAQILGRCVFLEPDGLCLIHELLGEEAKPATCRRFPLQLGLTPSEALVGADYSCLAMVLNRGEPVSVADGTLRGWLEEAGPDAMACRDAEPELLLAPGVRMDWAAYLRLESALLSILGRRDTPVTLRLASARDLTAAVGGKGGGGRRLGEADVGSWLEGNPPDSLAVPLCLSLPSVSELASSIGELESPHSSTTGRGTAALGYALAVAEGSGRIYLSTLEGWADLEALGRATCDLDAPAFDDYLTRYLSNQLLRQSLLKSPSLREGLDHLVRCLAMVRWYASASATISGRARTEVDDLVAGIQAVEKRYVP
ncbi:MAG: YkgJ family cysteine cluster protein [Chloroflexota bacterium]